MALIFRNGGSPNYTGEIFTNGTQLLTNFRDWLSSAGWTVVDDSISGSDFLLMRGNAANGDTCFFQFTFSNWTGVPGGKQFRIRGDIDGAGVTLSPIFNLNFIDGAENTIYLTADVDAACVFTEAFDGSKSGCHFGFLNRPDPNADASAIMIGRLDWRFNNSYFQEEFFSSGNYWQSAGAGFWRSDDVGTIENQCPYHGVSDRYVVGIKQGGYANQDRDNECGYSDNVDNRNPGYYFYQGALSPIDEKPILGEFFYLEGRDENNWGNNDQGDGLPSRCAFRGTVKFAVVGLGYYRAKYQVTDTNGYRYITVGNNGYQGFRIA